MSDQTPGRQQARPSFFGRLSLAFAAFFRIAGNADYASRIENLPDSEGPATAPKSTPAAPATPSAPETKPALRVLKEASPEAALQLLGILQRDARLVDFAQEDLSQYSDAEIGAAARVVHEGCRKVLREHFMIEPVLKETEGSSITVQPGFDAGAIRLTGNVVGSAPFSGTVGHRGWRAIEIHLPALAEGHNAHVVAPAEVEL
ncbi:DUF2760 domain-containing protein [Noviherbaspirillum pedocola]|uniref:DUF2760 domain-containing protein n=1 Tax=Noviherbaspirillum pedocola TaxID=2801341 RepID=A0A934W605_9BURK|nr:DUF2760 domain-containing protein [Noviherbaspirillum pedocola]MBK4735612.1 DUF2760 domain-containing protein [Noviherbaspirillum pedocola]